MAITVICPSCRASFRVDDKYAGRQGPCPKCKATITIPKVEKVVIHDETVTSTTAAAAQGTPQTKAPTHAIRPIARTEVQFKALPAVLIVLAVLAAFGAAYMFRGLIGRSELIRVIGIFAVGLPASIGMYSILRNDELEPYRGQALWWRASVCSLVFTLLWVGFHFIPPDFISDAYVLIAFVQMIVIGGATAMVLFDLEFSSGAFNYLIFFATTILLGYVAGLPWPWTPPPDPDFVPPLIPPVPYSSGLELPELLGHLAANALPQIWG